MIPVSWKLTGYILRPRGQGGRSAGPAGARRSWIRATYSLQQIALSYQFLGRYAESIAAMDRALAIVSDSRETRTFVYYFISSGKRTPGRRSK